MIHSVAYFKAKSSLPAPPGTSVPRFQRDSGRQNVANGTVADRMLPTGQWQTECCLRDSGRQNVANGTLANRMLPTGHWPTECYQRDSGRQNVANGTLADRMLPTGQWPHRVLNWLDQINFCTLVCSVSLYIVVCVQLTRHFVSAGAHYRVYPIGGVKQSNSQDSRSQRCFFPRGLTFK